MNSLKLLRDRVGKAGQVFRSGWRELFHRSSDALTHFDDSARTRQEPDQSRQFPSWSLLAGETWETAKAVLVRIEVPGVRKEDLEVTVTDDAVVLRGLKRSEGGPAGSREYGLMERAFGSFQRIVPLTHGVERTDPEISYRDGVVTVILQKREPAPPRAGSDA